MRSSCSPCEPETELGGAGHVNAHTWVGLDLATHNMGAADIQNKRGILAGLARNQRGTSEGPGKHLLT